jgi:hypothetical protein
MLTSAQLHARPTTGFCFAKGNIKCSSGRTKPHAVSRRLLISAAWVRALLRSCGHMGFVVNVGALRHVFSEYFCFSCYSSHRLLHTPQPLSGAGTIGQIVADVSGGLNKIWAFHCGDYEECHLLGHTTPVRTSQETHYVSTTESSQLMLCKIWGFHGGDYEEFRLLGYKTPVHTPQETHYISATEPSRLMLYKIWGFHRGDYDECRLHGLDALWFLLRTDVWEERSASIIRVTRIDELGTTLSVTSNRRTLRSNATRTTRRNISGNGIVRVM